MKYPAVLPLTEIISQREHIDTVIDVRSPSEYLQDHIGGAINCPVLDDAQRAQIGTIYKKISRFEAKKQGAVLIAKNIAQHIEKLFPDKPRDWQPLIYCWRGGNRSTAMAHIFAKIGWPVMLLEGGYKAYRQYVVASLAQLPQRLTFKVVCGSTGSGKSRLLHELALQGAQVLDLEQLAAHRGSVLGRLPSGEQSSQKSFESQIWQRLYSFDTRLPIFVEAESKKIGHLRVPDSLMQKMRVSPCILVKLVRSERVKLLLQDYAHFVTEPSLLNAQLDCLAYLYGHEKIRNWQHLALTGQMTELVEALLLQHYDPAYVQSIKRNFTQFAEAQEIVLHDIEATTFFNAAKQLHLY